MSPFELDWLGGTAERLHNRHGGDRVAAVPWERVQQDLTPQQRDRRRMIWTMSAHQEWCAAGAFSALVTAMIDARAPVDLVGMTGRFVADEMVHTELCARLAMAYGGGAPLQTDPAASTPVVGEGCDAMQRLLELAVRVSCVGESVSLPVLAGNLAACDDDATRAVLKTVVKDEGPHALVGWLVLDWALPRVDEVERERLGAVAADAIDALGTALDEAAGGEHAAQRILTRKVLQPLRDRGVIVPTP